MRIRGSKYNKYDSPTKKNKGELILWDVNNFAIFYFQ